MLAPTDKSNDTIQIVVTTACDRNCSNCTQLLPFRTDYKHMSVDVFREAVQSLIDWPGVVGVFGGNPCVHPKFPQLCEIIAELIPANRRGLWTNNVMKYGEIAAKTFGKGRLNLNAHGNEAAAKELDRWFPGRVIEGTAKNASWHSPMLLDWRDFPAQFPTYDAWAATRETCDINRRWSAAIAERDGKPYAYFCEVAAAIDGIRGENNGIPCEPGWWRFKIDRFDHQVRQCCDRGCGYPMAGLGHLDCEEVYDISPAWEGMAASNAPKQAVQVHDDLQGTVEQPTDYARRFTERQEANK